MHCVQALPILVFSMYAEDQRPLQYSPEGWRAGAHYVTKDSPSEQLLDAIAKLSKGRRYVSQELAEKFAEDLVQPADLTPTDVLSDLDFEIMRDLSLRGHTTTAIGKYLVAGVSGTVSTYRTPHAFCKLNLKTTSELIRYAIEHNVGR